MKKIILTIIASIALTGASLAGSFGIGVSGSMALVSAEGKEDTGGSQTNQNNANVSELSQIGSIFAEYQFDNGIAFGIETVPFSADVSDKVHTRSETAVGVSGADANGAIVRTANAEVKNFNTIYGEYPIGPAYVKLGYSEIDVNTKEKAITDSGSYGNVTLSGATIGVGARGSLGVFGGLFTKTSLEHTKFETLRLKSVGSSTANSITANLDVTQFKFAVGKTF